MSIFNPFFRDDHFSIFEIYPQSEIPLLTQIAYLDWMSSENEPVHLLPDTLICRVFHEDKIVFRVVDYRTNYSTCFSAHVKAINIEDDVEVFLFQVFSTVEVGF